MTARSKTDGNHMFPTGLSTSRKITINYEQEAGIPKTPDNKPPITGEKCQNMPPKNDNHSIIIKYLPMTH